MQDTEDVVKLLHVTDASFEAEVLKSEMPVLVDFWAEWCGPCRMVAPIVEQLASDYQDVIKVVKFNVDDNPEVSVKYEIMSIPTLILFKNGEIATKQVGYMPKPQLKKAIDAVL